MRVSKRGFILVAVLLMVIGVVWVVRSWPPSRSRRLADGTVLRVERVSFGKRDQTFLPAVSLWEEAKAKTAAMLPKKWAANIKLTKPSNNGSWWRWAKVHTNEDALHIWITQRDPTNGFGLVQANVAEIVDENGCVYPSTQEGGIQMATPVMRTGGGPMQSQVNWFTFEAFPRRQSEMRLRLYKSLWGGTDTSGGLLAEFLIMNPAPKPKNSIAWATEPLPIEKKFGDVTFTLKSVGYKTNWIEGLTNSFRGGYSKNPVEIVLKFEVHEGGKQAPEWEALDLDLRDGSGNIAPKQWGDHMSVFLSPRESAWKLAVMFFGSEREGGASNTVWVLRDVKVPGAAGCTAFTNEQDLDGVNLKPVALAGPGEAVFRGDEITNITASNSVTGNSIRFGASFNRGYSYGGTEEIVDAVTPYIAVRLGDLADDQRLTIRAVAPGGAEYYAEPWRYGTNPAHTNKFAYLEKGNPPYQLNYFPIDLPPEAKTVDLYFCVHRARTVEFIFKPPQQ